MLHRKRLKHICKRQRTKYYFIRKSAHIWSCSWHLLHLDCGGYLPNHHERVHKAHKWFTKSLLFCIKAVWVFNTIWISLVSKQHSFNAGAKQDHTGDVWRSAQDNNPRVKLCTDYRNDTHANCQTIFVFSHGLIPILRASTLRIPVCSYNLQL